MGVLPGQRYILPDTYWLYIAGSSFCSLDCQMINLHNFNGQNNYYFASTLLSPGAEGYWWPLKQFLSQQKKNFVLNVQALETLSTAFSSVRPSRCMCAPLSALGNTSTINIYKHNHKDLTLLSTSCNILWSWFYTCNWEDNVKSCDDSEGLKLNYYMQCLSIVYTESWHSQEK